MYLMRIGESGAEKPVARVIDGSDVHLSDVVAEPILFTKSRVVGPW